MLPRDPMKRLACLLAAPALIGAAAPLPPPVPGGDIGTLEQGRYTCELPGDATGPAGRHVPDADFTVMTASNYRAHGRQGSYLLTDDRVVMTNGAFKGRQFHRLSRGFLRELTADGKDGPLRCVLGRRLSDTPSPCPAAPADETAAAMLSDLRSGPPNC